MDIIERGMGREKETERQEQHETSANKEKGITQ